MKSVINFSLNATYNINNVTTGARFPSGTIESVILVDATPNRVESSWILSNRRKEGERERKREVRREKEGGKSGEKTKTKYKSIKGRSNKGKSERNRTEERQERNRKKTVEKRKKSRVQANGRKRYDP